MGIPIIFSKAIDKLFYEEIAGLRYAAPTMTGLHKPISRDCGSSPQ